MGRCGKQAEDIFTREERYSEDEDNNNDGDSNEEKAGADDDVVDDHQEEAEYLLGDEGPVIATEVLFTGEKIGALVWVGQGRMLNNKLKGAAFVRTKMKNYLIGNTVEKTFRAGSSVMHPNLQTLFYRLLFMRMMRCCLSLMTLLWLYFLYFFYVLEDETVITDRGHYILNNAC